MATLPAHPARPPLVSPGIMFVQEEALASSLSSTDSLTPEDRPIARGCSDSLESIPSGQVMPPLLFLGIAYLCGPTVLPGAVRK